MACDGHSGPHRLQREVGWDSGWHAAWRVCSRGVADRRVPGPKPTAPLLGCWSPVVGDTQGMLGIFDPHSCCQSRYLPSGPTPPGGSKFSESRSWWPTWARCPSVGGPGEQLPQDGALSSERKQRCGAAREPQRLQSPGPALPAQGPQEGPGEQGEPGLARNPCCGGRAGRLSLAGCPQLSLALRRSLTELCVPVFPSPRPSGHVLPWWGRCPVEEGASPGSAVSLTEETRAQGCLQGCEQEPPRGGAGACLPLPKGAEISLGRWTP